jgi:aspartyl-tRNA(Asn)/glutamyl-tRNA(Gln) amidotransferase subunit C
MFCPCLKEVRQQTLANKLSYDTLLALFQKVFAMSLTNADVRKVARLARLAMSEAEIETARTQLSGIFDLIAEMQAVDTKGIAPMSHAQELSQRLREDVVTEADQRAAFQEIAPQVEAGLYLVPQVIE